MFKKISEALINSPHKTLFLGLLIVASLLPGLTLIEADFSHRGFFSPNNPLIESFDKFERTFSGDDRIAIIIHNKEGVFKPKTAQVIKDMTEEIWNVKNIARVDSLANYSHTYSINDEIIIESFFEPDSDDDFEGLTSEFLKEREKIAQNEESLPGLLMSKDRKSAMILARFRPTLKKKLDYTDSILAIRKIVEKYKKEHDIFISGNGMVMFSFKEVSGQDTFLIVPLLFGTIFLLLIFLYRSFLGVFIPLVVILLSVMSTFGVAGYLGIKYNSIIAAIPIIITTIAIADSMHLLMSYYQGLSKFQNNLEACKLTTQKNILPTFLTSFSTAIGFISLASSELLPISGIGYLGAAGSLLAWVITFLICVPILVLQNPKSFTVENKKVIIPQGLVRKYLQFIEKRKKSIIAGFSILCIMLISLGAQNKISSDPMKYLAKSVPFRIATDFMDENIGGASGPEIVVHSGEVDGVKDPRFAKKIVSLVEWMENRKSYTKIVSYIDILKKLNRAFNNMDEKFYKLPDSKEKIAQFLFMYSLSLPEGLSISDQVSVDNESIRITAFWTHHESNIVLREIDLIEKKIEELGLEGYVTGKLPIYQRMNGYVVQTFFSSIFSALVLIAFLMIFIFKSFKLGLLSMIPNITPLFFGLATMTLMERPLDIGIVITGAICLGIAVDDTIHLLSHYSKNKSQGLSTFDSLENVLIDSGSALIGTTFILVCGFSTFLLGSFVPNTNLGVSTAIILGSAVFIDLFILPALLFLSGKNS